MRDRKAAGTEWDDLQQSSGHSQVLHKLNELVLIGKIGVEKDGRCEREDRKDERREACCKSRQKKGSANQFNRGTCLIHGGRVRQARGRDIGLRFRWRKQLMEAVRQENRGHHETAYGS